MDWAAFAQYTKIPFHAGEKYDGFAIVPGDGGTDFAGLVSGLQGTRKQLSRLKSIAPDPRAQAKYQRSIEWVEHLIAHWDNIATKYEPWKELVPR
jgi:hypothetical protein